MHELVEQARAGSLEAFEELYRANQAGIYTFILSQVRRPELAADLTQQTFVRAWESLSRLRTPEAFRGWLHRIAGNLVRDEVKSGRARLEVATSDLGELEFADPDQPEKTMLDEEFRKQVWGALESLSVEQRTVVVLHHLEGMPVTEIAKIVGVRPGTVMSRLARARETLKQRLCRYLEAECYEM